MQMYVSGCAKRETKHVSLTLKAAFQQSKNKKYCDVALVCSTLPSADNWQGFENSSPGTMQNSNRT